MRISCISLTYGNAIPGRATRALAPTVAASVAMPLYELTPVMAGLDNADWAGSTHRGPCRVVASDERRARLFAANVFTDRAATRTPAGLLPASPWMRRGLVAAERLVGLADNLKADGTVLVPTDPDDPAGAYRVMGTGRIMLSGPFADPPRQCHPHHHARGTSGDGESRRREPPQRSGPPPKGLRRGVPGDRGGRAQGRPSRTPGGREGAGEFGGRYSGRASPASGPAADIPPR